jgi:hypothetical protein
VDAIAKRPRRPWKGRADLDDVIHASLRQGLSFGLIARKVSELLGYRVSREATIGRAYRIRAHGAAKPLTQINNHPPKKKRIETGAAFVEKLCRVRPTATPSVERQLPAPAPQIPAGTGFLSIALIDLEQTHCRYPHGDGLAVRFCGQAKVEGSAYCAAHTRLCYVKGKAPTS